MSILNNSLLLGAPAGAAGYSIPRSLRFNPVDTPSLTRTPASSSNQQTWTFSVWIKRCLLSSRQGLFASSDSGGASYTAIELTAADEIKINSQGTGLATIAVTTTNLLRDPSAWYHLVVYVDTTQSTASNSVKIYINGVEAALSSTTYPAQNSNTRINTTNSHTIGKFGDIAGLQLGAMLADIYFIDGQALTPSSFGQTDTNGIWQPKTYSGTYGTNGFHLPLSDNSAATATTLGKDSAGSNNYTPNNFSVTAGAGNDSLVDSPTNGTASSGGDAGGVVVGNYCTLNPLDTNLATIANLKNGNLEIIPGAAYSGIAQGANSTIGVATGKWYFEGSPVTSSGLGNQSSFGWTQSKAPSGTFYADDKASCIGVNCDTYGNLALFKTAGVSASLATNTNLAIGAVSGDIFQLAIDFDAGKFWVGKNGTWYSSGNPGAGTNATSTFTNSGLTWRIWVETAAFSGNWNQAVVNFGQRPFAYAAPSGFKSLNTANLPTPPILAGNTAFDTKLYTGNGSTQTISGLAFSPDFVWAKARSNNSDHTLFDVVRGTGKYLRSNGTNDETTDANSLTAFNSNGFSLGSSIVSNDTAITYAAWCWDAGTSTVTNTAGSITSQVRANASAGVSIVTWTGTSTNATVGHGLGVAPQLVIVKRKDAGSAGSWATWHTSIANTQYLLLESSAAVATSSSYWNSTSPTSNVFSVGTSSNTNSGSLVAYCFAPVSNFNAFGSYIGNGSSDGPFIYTGMRPKWLLIKRTDATRNWFILDTVRDTYNAIGLGLKPNLIDLEADFRPAIDILSNGFKIRSTDTNWNISTGTYLYACFSENPFSIARAR